MSQVEDIIEILRDSLQLGERARSFNPGTPLLGSLAELDSMAVVAVITAIEDRYGFVVNDDEVSAETFETVGSLHSFVNRKLGT